jgi:hypothetical protein
VTRSPSWWLIGAIGLQLACTGRGSTGDLSASWIGSDTASFSAPATALWCARERYLELSSVEVDTGVGLVLYPVDSLGSGDYPVFNPGGGTSPRPGAAVAARWFTQTLIKGYQSDSGRVHLVVSPAGRFSGSIAARLHNGQGSGVIRLKGEFTGVRTDSTPLRCPSDTIHTKPDSGVT